MLISVTFITLYLFDLRKLAQKQKGTWWNKLRPIHESSILFSIYTFKRKIMDIFITRYNTRIYLLYLKYYEDIII